MLSDLPLEAVAGAVTTLVCTSRFLPAISEIREAAAELVLGIPTADEALAQVARRMAWARDGRAGDRPEVAPLVNAALQHVGGFPSFRDTDSPSVVRGQFLRLYREMRGDAVRAVQIAPLPQLEATPPHLEIEAADLRQPPPGVS